MAKTGLGKGFGSLLPDNFDQSVMLDKQDRVQKMLIQDIKPNPNQPRREFDQEAIKELASSIKRFGILQPLIITRLDDHHIIVAGERRWHAAQKAGLSHVPVLVRTTEELDRLEIGLIENMQRVDLSPLEQAASIDRLHQEFNFPLQDIATRLGKSHASVTNTVRLLLLPDFAKKSLNDRMISEGHARAVLAVKDETKQRQLIDNIEQYSWSVRQAEEFVANLKEEEKPEVVKNKAERAVVNQKTSKDLSTKWGFKVTVASKGKGGRIAMEFTSQKQLEEFIKFLESQKS